MTVDEAQAIARELGEARAAMLAAVARFNVAQQAWNAMPLSFEPGPVEAIQWNDLADQASEGR